MAEQRLDQRTFYIGLKYESDDTRNFNWGKIDDAIGQLQRLMEDTMNPPIPLIPRSAVGNIATTQLTTAPQQVAQVQLSPSGGGPILCIGTLGCRIQNANATVVTTLLELTLSRSMSSTTESHTLDIQVSLDASQTTILFQIPVLWFFTTIDPVPVSPTNISLTMAELQGTAGVTTWVQFGYVQATEFLGQVRAE
jgi:hypothetical protein